MDFKEARVQLHSLRADEDLKTVSFLCSRLPLSTSVLDLSNKFLFDSATRELISRLQTHYETENCIRKIVMQNTMLETEKLNAILRKLGEIKGKLALDWIDVGNNRIELTEETAELLGTLMSKRTNSRPKTVILQGNLVRSGQVLRQFFSRVGPLLELNLYDTRLSVEALAALSDALSLNSKVRRLDLGYNAEAFTSKSVLTAFGMAISLNSHLEDVNLCGNSPLGKMKLLTAFCSGLQCSKHLEKLGMGGLQLRRPGVDLLSRFLLRAVPICELDLHNNGLSAASISHLLPNLSVYTTVLDLSYNCIRDESALLSIADHLTNTRSLRCLNISHTIEIEELSYKAKQRLADAIQRNDSLTEFFCEGAKIGDDPDDFCEILGAAISDRRLSLTFKISAVNCFSVQSTPSEGDSDCSSATSPAVKSVQSLPVTSVSKPKVNSTQHTERRGFEGREISLSETPREYRFTSSSQLDLSSN